MQKNTLKNFQRYPYSLTGTLAPSFIKKPSTFLQRWIQKILQFAKDLLSCEKKSCCLYLLGLLILTYFLYSNSLYNELLDFDDREYFDDYPEVIELSWQSLKLYFSRYYVIMYQPLPVLSFALNYYFTKTAVLPLHLVNLIFHLMNVILVYLFFNKLAGRSSVALIVTSLFAIHPMNVEAVSWFSARSSGMYAFFYLSALILYLHYLDRRQKKYFFFTLLMFLFSLFSKAQAITLPLILLVLDYFYPLNLEKKVLPKNDQSGSPVYYSFCTKISKRTAAFLPKIPFFALSILFGVIALLEKDTANNIANGALISYTSAEIIILLCYSLVFYLCKFLLPINLCAIYVYPPRVNGYLPLECYLSPLILLAAMILIYKLAKNRQYVLFGVLFFFIAISINIQIIPSRLFIVTERYAYLPYLGFFFIIGGWYSELINKPGLAQLIAKRLLMSSLVIIGFSYSLLTVQRNPVWKDNVTLMTDIINKNPQAFYLSRAYGTRGNAFLAKNKLQNAFRDYGKAIETNPHDIVSYSNRGLLYLRLKKYPEAIKDFDKVLAINPRVALLYSSRATAKYHLKDQKGALEDFDKALLLNPQLIDAHNLRAIIKFSFEDYQGSEDDFKQAISLNPRNGDLYKNKGVLFLKLNQLAKACKDFSVASDLGDASAFKLKKKYC